MHLENLVYDEYVWSGPVEIELLSIIDLKVQAIIYMKDNPSGYIDQQMHNFFNFGRAYIVEHDVKVKWNGEISKASMKSLLFYWIQHCQSEWLSSVSRTFLVKISHIRF